MSESPLIIKSKAFALEVIRACNQKHKVVFCQRVSILSQVSKNIFLTLPIAKARGFTASSINTFLELKN